MTAGEGWKRFAGHFLLFGAAPAALGYILHLAGASQLPLWATIIALAATGVVVWFMERSSTRRGKQTVGKAVIDWFAKLLGLAAGLASAYGWGRRKKS